MSIDLGMQFLESAAKGAAQIDRFDSAVDAVNAAAENDFDLIVTRWGHGEGSTGEAVAVELLKEIRARDVRAPVVVFASGSHADANKRIAMGLGATSYEYSWEGLFQEVERIFTPGSGRP
jgi:DNA-binding NarL/FixJ family response regulator